MEEWCVLPAQAFLTSRGEQEDQGTEQRPELPVIISTSDTHGEESTQRKCLPPLDLGEGRVTQSCPEAGPLGP